MSNKLYYKPKALSFDSDGIVGAEKLTVKIGEGLKSTKCFRYVVGNPGSGKSTMIEKAIKGGLELQDCFVFDVDNYKNPRLGCLLELTQFGEKKLLEAMENKKDIIIPCTYRGIMKASKRFDEIISCGYEIHITYLSVDLAREKQRNSERLWPVPDEEFVTQEEADKIRTKIHDKFVEASDDKKNNADKKENIALYTGSFDPFTLGHLNIVERASKMFDKVIVCVASNPNKVYQWGIRERESMVSSSLAHLSNVSVVDTVSLVADVAEKCGAKVIIRGVRSVTDFEYEMDIARINSNLNKELETIFIPCDVQYSHISSSSVKELGQHGVSLEGMVHESIIEMVSEELKMS